MQNSPPSADGDAQRDRQLAADLELLRREREQIMAAFNAPSSPLFQKQEALALKRLHIAADHRDLQLSGLGANFHLQLQQAYNEFECDKRRLRTRMLSASVDKRRRLDTMRGLHKKRRRSRGHYERVGRQSVVSPYLNRLEKQGVLRVTLTPDELTADMNDLLNAIDVPVHKSYTHTDRVSDAVLLDKIHSSKGTLHYHDVRLEKGDAVEVYWTGKSGGVIIEGKRVLKYCGVLLSVNAKEIHIRTDNGADHRIYVSHLRSGKLALKIGGSANGDAVMNASGR
ncbi:unnamed protein product [Agarophyton chilense]|eukprot:gb/GEZJ01001410.1/.p2 GENE.gb/GEZJ01001410.1/~~gb/GEZJ01001410.1/.p2  ORF type:complete len:283 (-),score=35.92 gb/GEZJ01001410.1/:626-1474(-)